MTNDIEENTVIGFYHEHSKAYCPHCKKVYIYHWNGYNPFSKNKTCPSCGNSKDIVSENEIEMRIYMFEMARSLGEQTDERRKDINKQISDLHAIRRKFDNYDERESRD